MSRSLLYIKHGVLYLESVKSDNAEFQERTDWRKKLPSLPRWPSRRKANKRKPRGADRCADGDEPASKRKCSTRSKVAGVFTSGASAALIKDHFLIRRVWLNRRGL